MAEHKAGLKEKPPAWTSVCLSLLFTSTSLPNQRDSHCSLLSDMCKYLYFVLFFFYCCMFVCVCFSEGVFLNYFHCILIMGVLQVRKGKTKNKNKKPNKTKPELPVLLRKCSDFCITSWFFNF